MENSTCGKFNLWKIPSAENSTLGKFLIFHASLTNFENFISFLFWCVHHCIPCMQNTEETFAKYAVDANLFRLGSNNPKKKQCIFFSKMFKFTWNKNEISDFSVFYFSSHRHFCTPIFHKWNFPWVEFSISGIFHRWNFPGGIFLGGIYLPP